MRRTTDECSRRDVNPAILNTRPPHCLCSHSRYWHFIRGRNGISNKLAACCQRYYTNYCIITNGVNIIPRYVALLWSTHTVMHPEDSVHLYTIRTSSFGVYWVYFAWTVGVSSDLFNHMPRRSPSVNKGWSCQVRYYARHSSNIHPLAHILGTFALILVVTHFSSVP